jgi:hypothetical protein
MVLRIMRIPLSLANCPSVGSYAREERVVWTNPSKPTPGLG